MITGPLADRMRPEDFAHVYGDRKLFGENGIFARMIASKHIPNMIFFGNGENNVCKHSCKGFGKNALQAKRHKRRHF